MILGDGLRMEYGSSRISGMTLEDLERFVMGARAAGANGDEIVKVETRISGKVRKIKVEYAEIPKDYIDLAKSVNVIPAQRSGDDVP